MNPDVIVASLAAVVAILLGLAGIYRFRFQQFMSDQPDRLRNLRLQRVAVLHTHRASDADRVVSIDRARYRRQVDDLLKR